MRLPSQSAASATVQEKPSAMQQFPAYKFNYKSMRYDHAENFYSACVEYT
jgi:hypothetical protein